MTKHEANAALCLHLGFDRRRRDLSRLDALTVALDKAGVEYEIESTRGWKSARLLAFDSRMEGRTVAEALFLAACASFGIEVKP